MRSLWEGALDICTFDLVHGSVLESHRIRGRITLTSTPFFCSEQR